jgi:aminomethyltransferase
MVGAWHLPMVYTDLSEECSAVRNGGAGLIDMTSMGKLFVEGESAEELLDYLCVNDVKGLQIGRACYTSMCAPDGRMIDDDTVYKFAPEKFLVVTSTANRANTERWLIQWSERFGYKMKIRNETETWGLLAVQGPESANILKEAIGPETNDLNYFDFCEVEFDHVKILISRTGYTGELGFEIYVPEEKAEDIWNVLMKIGNNYEMKPVGLGAALALRLEKGYPLWGRDIGEMTSPLEAGLGWTVRYDAKGDFVGRLALEQQKKEGVSRRLTGFMMADKHARLPHGTPKKGCPITANGRTVGHVTSAGYSYLLDKCIGMGYIDVDHCELGTELMIYVDGMRYRAKVAERPLYDPKGDKLKAEIK